MKLKLSPKAYHKLMWLNQYTKDETSGLGITSIEDPLYVLDIIVPKQVVTSVTTEFDDEGLADIAAELCSKGYEMCQFMRIWVHTHPAGVSSPSNVDEETFDRALGKADWAVMLILPKDGKFYCKLRMKALGLKESVEVVIPVEVDWLNAPKEWVEEFDLNVSGKVTIPYQSFKTAWKGPAAKETDWDMLPEYEWQQKTETTEYYSDKELTEILKDMYKEGFLTHPELEESLAAIQKGIALPFGVDEQIDFYMGYGV